MSAIITLAQLKRLGACTDETSQFERLFGSSIEVTEACCVQHAAQFDWNWAAEHLLSQDALAEYQRVRATASAEYERVMAAARAEFDRMWAARAEYKRVRAAANAEYQSTRATAFARLYIREAAEADARTTAETKAAETKATDELIHAINAYADACRADEVKGGGDPASIPEIEARLKRTQQQLAFHIQRM